MLDTVTYPEPAVAAVTEQFIPMQVNTMEEWGKPLVERFRQVWTPDVRVVDDGGFDLYRWNGYLPPYEFLPQLLVALAHARLRLHDEAGAAAMYEDVARRFPTSAVAAEAQYFLAVSAYKASHDGSDLGRNWQRLQKRYPDSIWRVKQSFSEQGS